MAARTEVLLGESPHDPGARCAGSSVSGRTHPSQHQAISGASAVFRGFRPAALPTATTRDRSRLGLIAAILQEVLGVSGDPDVGQQRRVRPVKYTYKAA
jgi:hypothetical protein